MGGAVSAGRDNNDLIDNLVASNYIRSLKVQKAFRAVDRADYILQEKRDDAYKDLAWKDGLLHLSAPCIYSEVMEALEFEEGLSFLNLGSGTGYLSTMAGLLLGTNGINHGIELHGSVIEYAHKRLAEFKKNSPSVDEFDFCEPVFAKGNGLRLSPSGVQYDRVYCGAGCPPQYENYLKNLIKVGGIVVAPMQETLIQIKRINATEWKTKSLLSVTFAPLVMPAQMDNTNGINPFDIAPASLQIMSRFAIRNELRKAMFREQPALEEVPIRPIPKKPSSTRRICIPINPAAENFNMFDDYVDPDDAEEMNALLSLVLDLGHNRVAGALRFDNITPSESERDEHSSSMSTVEEDNSDRESEEDDLSPDFRLETAEQDLEEVKLTLAELSRPNPDFSVEETARAENGAFLAALSRITKLERDIAKYKKIAKRNSLKTKEMPSSSGTKQDCSAGEASTSADEAPKTCDEVEKPSEENETMEVESLKKDSKEEEKAEKKSEDVDEPGPSNEIIKSVKKERKRSKLDSGIGDESIENSDESEENRDVKTRNISSDNRPAKRTRNRDDVSMMTDSSSDENEEPIRPTRQKVKKISTPDACEVRRNQISTIMKEKVKNLTLPLPLRVYVNLGRTLE